MTSSSNFNSHAHVERDPIKVILRISQKNFNSHAHVERDIKERASSKAEMNFNSHAHVERDDLRTYGAQVMNISTHTLTWSVTKRP